MTEVKVVIRGGGDLATGVAHRLYKAGFSVVMTEQKQPSVIRRTVAFANVLYEEGMTVEGVCARAVHSREEVEEAWRRGEIPVWPEEAGKVCQTLQADVLVDATLSKKNTGVNRGMAPIVIGIGPGFEAGVDVDAVVESQRGHHLGRVLYQGRAAPNSGVPGIIDGVGRERLLKAPCEGVFQAKASIGDVVKAGQKVATVGDKPVVTAIDGLLRGLLADGLSVTEGFKVGDVDPRINPDYCTTISDKARAMGGAVLEAVMHLRHVKETKSPFSPTD